MITEPHLHIFNVKSYGSPIAFIRIPTKVCDFWSGMRQI